MLANFKRDLLLRVKKNAYSENCRRINGNNFNIIVSIIKTAVIEMAYLSVVKVGSLAVNRSIASKIPIIPITFLVDSAFSCWPNPGTHHVTVPREPT